MKRKIIFSLFLMFLLFLAGAGLTMLSMYRTTSDLESVINLHKIEIIRQNLVINLQTVQSNLYATGTIFGKELDAIVDNVTALDNSVTGCISCHHDAEMTERLNTVARTVDQYKEAISFLVTSTANEERIARLKTVAVGIGDALLDKTQEMTSIAERSLNQKTVKAVRAIERSRTILIVTLVLSFIIALVVAFTMTRGITRPVDELVGASRMIASGRLGYKTSYHDKTEFGEVAESFNVMSTALKAEREKIDLFVEQLSGLYQITLSFYLIAEPGEVYPQVCGSISGLLKVRQCVLVLLNGDRMMFEPAASAVALSGGETAALTFTPAQLEEYFKMSGGLPIVVPASADSVFAPLASGEAGTSNMLLSWLSRKGRVLGFLRVSGKDGDFTDEDSKLLTILSTHMAVAMENANLYRDLQDKMTELRETQEQLIQSAKLAAIGELASNVAHEINNPLTSIIGFTEMSKEEDDAGVVRENLEIIEKESLRAREIVRQLLGFARKKPLDLGEININEVLGEVIPLVSLQAKTNRVRITEKYALLPSTTGDADQLKQVFINIVNNALSAMPGGGDLFIETAMQDAQLLVTFRDTGLGIPKAVLNRIFEPFFTTKNEKGTGLGLSISYRIIQDHGGRIEVESLEGRGTTFTVRLPHACPLRMT